MSSSLTIVLEDHEKLTEMCGVNDENLKILEKLSGLTSFERDLGVVDNQGFDLGSLLKVIKLMG